MRRIFDNRICRSQIFSDSISLPFLVLWNLQFEVQNFSWSILSLCSDFWMFVLLDWYIRVLWACSSIVIEGNFKDSAISDFLEHTLSIVKAYALSVSDPYVKIHFLRGEEEFFCNKILLPKFIKPLYYSQVILLKL